MIENKVIVCDSNIPWDHNRYSKHHIMSRLAKKNKVIFVNPQVDPFEFLRAKKYNPFGLFDRSERPGGESLEVFTPLALPFRNKFEFVHRIAPRGFALQLKKILKLQLKKILKGIDPRNLILFMGNPWNVFLLDYFGDCACSIYHCSDNFPAFFRSSFGQLVAQRENRLLSEVDLVLAVSEPLLEKCLRLNRNSYLVSHGVDEMFFIRPAKVFPEPDDLKLIRRPRIGFVGSIDWTVDYELVRHVVAVHADKSFVFIGPVDSGSKTVFEEVVARPNMFHLGTKLWTELPAYLQGLDLCLMPFVSNEWIKYSSPLKLVEYLASGRQVISTIPVSERFNSAVKVATSQAEFARVIEDALSQASRDHPSAMEISALVKDQTWTAKVEEISTLIETNINLKLDRF
jgi:glycosyltransferase involved in cell wall biosynthesis